MSEDLKNIETLLKKSFEDFEAEVPSEAWINIQKNIQVVKPGQKTPTDTAKVSSLSKIVKLISLLAVSGGILTGLFYFANKKEKITETTASETLKPENTESQKNTPGNKPVSSLSHQDQTEEHQNKQDKTNSTYFRNPVRDLGGFSERAYRSKPNPATGNKPEEGSTNEHDYSPSLVKNDENGEEETSGLPEAKASITATPSEGRAPLTVLFSNNGQGLYYEWNFGDGTSVSNYPNPTHVYEKYGNYQVTLTVKDAQQNKALDTLTINVIASSNIQRPIMNVFTPNGDNINDLFIIHGENLISMEVIIFNRGNKIYTWSSLEGSWDGRDLTGTDLPSGTYFFLVKAVGLDGKISEEKGSITLIR